jgi:murein DD-endopeptidase MepM/ murein hydrolase activator NlpD
MSAGSHAAASDWTVAAAAEERLLGSADETALLPYKRQLHAGGIVTGSLADSLIAAGVPASTSLEALRALGAHVDLERDIATGDRFHVRYEQTFTLAGERIGVGRVLWLELVTQAKGTIAIHRFQPKGSIEQFWFADGQPASPAMMREPLDVMTLTSGYGLRADPLDHPSSGTQPAVVAVVPTPPPAPPVEVQAAREIRGAQQAYAAFDSMQFGNTREAAVRNPELDRIAADRLERAVQARAAAAKRMRAIEEQERKRAEELAALRPAPPPPPPIETPRQPRQLYMHEGQDLLAAVGTPVYAAADGVVMSLGPNGGYGNFIRLLHAERLSTIYGHLSRFAPGLEAGQPVAKGELIGFVGNTGRSTGAHLHFEIQVNGRPINPATAPSLHCTKLGGADLTLFKKQVAASLAERERESRL